MDPTYPLVPISNFLACILVLASITKSMFQTCNVGVCSLVTWVMITGFTVAVNAIIWADNVENVAPLWCDIGECFQHFFCRMQILHLRLQFAAIPALSAALFVIIRRLSLRLCQRDTLTMKGRVVSHSWDQIRIFSHALAEYGSAS